MDEYLGGGCLRLKTSVNKVKLQDFALPVNPQFSRENYKYVSGSSLKACTHTPLHTYMQESLENTL